MNMGPTGTNRAFIQDIMDIWGITQGTITVMSTKGITTIHSITGIMKRMLNNTNIITLM
jgi:hypothetical protein